ncbi:MAG: YdcF family protein [Rhizobiaceae bacterium]|nr:YdcF family protein [Rhizobiaceae bacterium]
MFFYLSKIFWFVAQPLNLSILLLFAGFAICLAGSRRIGLSAFVLALAVLSLATWTSLGQLLLGPLEDRFPRPPAPESVAGIVVLGGGFEGAINLARGGYELNSGGDRYVETAILARRYPEARVVVTGGTGTLVLEGEGDGATAPRLLEALGVARERMVLENDSRDTYENAQFTKALVTPRPGETWLLVTSAFHMPRSMALFAKADFAVTAWPVDYRTTGREGVSLFADNPIDSVQAATIGLREWIGLLAYWLTGRIDSPFPGPP